jgi:hypothetical protein
MARQKRRKTKKSRSQSPAARPQLTLGDVVRVKNGVMDPDYDGYYITNGVSLLQTTNMYRTLQTNRTHF